MATSSGKPTLATVAEAAGVSAATVSYAFNRPDKLSEATRTRILAIADRLGYGGPDPTAAGLRRGRVGVVGAIVPDSLSYAFSDPAVVVMLDGLAEALDPAGVSILLLSGGGARRDPDPLAIRSAVVDGFVLSGGVENPGLRAALARRRLPVVALGGGTGKGRLHVDLSEEDGAAALAEHLVDLGHRRIGIVSLRSRDDAVSGPMDGTRRTSIVYGPTRRRLAGTLRVLAAHGLDPDGVPVYEVDHNAPEEGATAARWLLARHPAPTAIVCQSDQLAIGALDAAVAAGRRVPHDVSIAGFDDIGLAARTTPPLTTVRQPLRERGRVAGALLLAAIEGRRVRGTTLPTELVVRSSTAPPPIAR